MSQINANFQDIMSNNRTAIISSEALQGFSMANQFAICANSGNGPVLLSCLTPMLLPTLTGNGKGGYELSGGGVAGGDGRGQPQTVQIQLSSPFNLAGNLCGGSNNGQSLPSLGLSYINLSSLTNAGNSFPLQITLNNASGVNNGGQQLTLPAAALGNLGQEVQIAQNYQMNTQLKFEADMTSSGGQQQQQQSQQLTIVSRGQDISSDNIDDKTKRKPRRRIPNKSNKPVAVAVTNSGQTMVATTVAGTEERLLDHKGRPFIYNCPNCPKKFTLNSRLTAHLRCHTGIRPYTCVQCGFSFTQKSYLIRHAAVHTEERPFTCERCLKTYKHYGSLANHRKLHRKEDKQGGGGNTGNGGTSDVSAGDSVDLGQSAPCDVVTTTTATTASLVDQSNYDNILQLHSDWSTVASSMSDNHGGGGTYLITSSSNTAVAVATDNPVYYTDASVTAGPVAFPDQQGIENNSQGLLCASNKPSHSSLFLMPSSSSSSSIASNHNTCNDTIIYTQVELASDPHQSQTYSATFSTTNPV